MKRFRRADAGQDGEGALAKQERTEPALMPAQENRMESRVERPAENRSGTIEASPIPRGAIGVIAAKKYHAIDDKELTKLKQLEKPLSLAMATVFGGIFMGSAWPASGTIQELFTGVGPPSSHDLILMIVCLVSLGISLAAAFASAKSRTKLTGAIETIRKRAKIVLPAGHPLAPN